MATTLAITQIKALVSWDYENILTGGNTSNINSQSFSSALTNGTGAGGTADQMYMTTATIAASGNTTVTFTSLANFFGTAISYARIKTMLIQLTTDTTASSILVGNGTNPFINWITPSTGAIRIRNGGCFLLSCLDATAYAVTAATGDLLKILNEDGANQATVKMTFVGSSA
jgi:hypothetical protein